MVLVIPQNRLVWDFILFLVLLGLFSDKVGVLKNQIPFGLSVS